jgi:uncharacterized membrane protein
MMADVTRSLSQPGMRRPDTRALPTNGPVNVGDGERWLSLLGGGLLALYALRRSLGTIVLVCGAGALLYRGWRGQCALYQAMGLSTAEPDTRPESLQGVAAPNEHPLIVLAGS